MNAVDAIIVNIVVATGFVLFLVIRFAGVRFEACAVNEVRHLRVDVDSEAETDVPARVARHLFDSLDLFFVIERDFAGNCARCRGRAKKRNAHRSAPDKSFG